MPGFKEATREWFRSLNVNILAFSTDNICTNINNRIYKMPDGKPENVFGFDGAYKDPEFAKKVV